MGSAKHHIAPGSCRYTTAVRRAERQALLAQSSSIMRPNFNLKEACH
jgi:hypothetical protein